MANLKVLFLITHLWSGGGTETHLRVLVQECIANGLRVGILTQGGPWLKSFVDMGATSHLYTGALTDAAINTVLRQHGYTIAHAHDNQSWQALSRRRRGNTRCVVTWHGMYMVPQRSQPMLKRTDAIIVVSPALHEAARQLHIVAPHVYLIANGIDGAYATKRVTVNPLLQNHNIPQGNFVIGYAGRFTFEKKSLGRRIVQLSRQYANTHPNTHVLIAGRGSREQGFPVSPRVHILGHVNQMAPFYQACSVVIGTGRVALEAMASGIPCIALGQARLYGLITRNNFDTALVSNFGDHGKRIAWTERRLVQSLESVRTNPIQWQRTTWQLQQRIKTEYSATTMFAATRKVYEDVL